MRLPAPEDVEVRRAEIMTRKDGQPRYVYQDGNGWHTMPACQIPYAPRYLVWKDGDCVVIRWIDSPAGCPEYERTVLTAR